MILKDKKTGLILKDKNSNKILKGVESSSYDGFLYLTYFDRYPDEPTPYQQNWYDLPTVGPIVLFNQPPTRSTMSDWSDREFSPRQTSKEYIGVPCAKLASIAFGTTDLLQFINGEETVSVEFILNFSRDYDSRGNPWGGVSSGIQDSSSYYSAGFNYYSSDRGIYIGYPNARYSYINPDFGMGAYDSNRCGFFTPIDKNWRQCRGVHHFAYVFDRVNNVVKMYFDGVLAAISVQGILNPTSVSFGNSSYYVGLECTQYAIRRGDLSTDSGMRYPVPEKPYRKF